MTGRIKTPRSGGIVLAYTDITAQAAAPTLSTDGVPLVSAPEDQIGRRSGAPHHFEMRFEFSDADQQTDIAVWLFYPEDDTAGKWYLDSLQSLQGGQLITRMTACRRNATRLYLQVVTGITGTLHAAVDAVQTVYPPDRDISVTPEVKAQDDAPTPGGLVQTVQHVSLDGHILRSGFYAGDAIYVHLSNSDHLAQILASLKDGVSLYQSGRDFSAAYASATTLDLTGLPVAVPTTDNFRGVLVLDEANQRFLSPVDVEFSFAPGAANEGVLTVDGAAFHSSDETFIVFLFGPVRAYDAATDTTKAKITNGVIDAHLKRADAVGAVTQIVQVTQHQDLTGNVQPAGDVVTRPVHTAVGDGTTTGQVKQVNADGNTTDKALVVQAQDKTGNVAPAGDVNTRAGFVKLTDGTLDATLKRADTAAAVANIVQAVQHIDESGKTQPAGDVNTRAVWTRLTNAAGDTDALIRDGNATAAASDNVVLVQAQDKTGNVQPAGNANDNAPFVKLTNGTEDALIREANGTVAIDDEVLVVQHQDAAGNILASGAGIDSAIHSKDFMAVLRGDTSTIRSPGDFGAAHATATTLALTALPFDPDAEDFIAVFVPDAATRRILTPLTNAFGYTVTALGEGTLEVADADFDAGETFIVLLKGEYRTYKAADDTVTTDTVLQAVQHVGQDGNALPSGASTDPIHVDAGATSAISMAALATGVDLYQSPRHFAAAHTSATELALTGLPVAVPDTSDFRGVLILDDNDQRFLSPTEVAFAFATTGAGTGTLTVTGAAFDAAETFIVLLAGNTRGYDAALGEHSVKESNPFWEQDEYQVIADVTDGPDATYHYYIPLEGKRLWTLVYNVVAGDGTCEMSIHASVQKDSAPETADYRDKGLEWFGAATFTGEGELEMDVPITRGWLRVTIVADGAGVGALSSWFAEILKAVTG